MQRVFIIYFDGTHIQIPNVVSVNGSKPSDSLWLWDGAVARQLFTLETVSAQLYHFVASHIAGFRSWEIEDGSTKAAYAEVKL